MIHYPASLSEFTTGDRVQKANSFPDGEEPEQGKIFDILESKKDQNPD